MFGTELKINGVLIGYLRGHNTCYNYNGKILYTYRYFRPEDGRLVEGEVLHDYNDGLEKLHAIIFEDVFKKLKE